MKTTIARTRRAVIPKVLRERKRRFDIEPAPTRMTLKQRGRVRVAVPEHKLPALTDEIVREIIEQTRRQGK